MKSRPTPFDIRNLEIGQTVSYRSIQLEGDLLIKLGVVSIQDSGLPVVEASMIGESQLEKRFNTLGLRGALLGSSIVVRDALGAENAHFGMASGKLVQGEMVVMQAAQEGELVHVVLPTPDLHSLRVE